LPLVSTPPPICPTCGQHATLALAAPTERWECRNEACPEFGQVLDPGVDRPDVEQQRRFSDVGRDRP
jgi:hypothetical protein